jgi:hypothetical protein
MYLKLKAKNKEQFLFLALLNVTNLNLFMSVHKFYTQELN